MAQAVPDGFAAVAAAIEGRRSVRGFLDRPVDPALVERLLALAARAPIRTTDRTRLTPAGPRG